MDNVEVIINELNHELNSFYTKEIKRKESSLSKKYFKRCQNEQEQLSLFRKLTQSENFTLFSIATLWVKNNPILLSMDHFDLYESLLFKNIKDWSFCDQYCYRVLNPMLEAFPEIFIHVVDWAKSDRVYVRRASAVCLIHSSTAFSVNVAFDSVSTLCDCLMNDKAIHVQKGMGWLLKYAYLSYPEETVNYLKRNAERMCSITYAYALEKMPKNTKEMLRAFRKQNEER